MFRFITPSAHKAHTPIVRSQPLSSAEKGISVGLIITAGAASILALHAISFLAQIIATPIIFGICIGLVIHIALYGPKESIECGKEILHQTPRALEALIKKTPNMLHQAANVAHQITDSTKELSYNGLQYVGSQVNPPSKTPYTVRDVAKGLVVEGRSRLQKAHKKHSPIIRQYVRSGWEFVRDSGN